MVDEPQNINDPKMTDDEAKAERVKPKGTHHDPSRHMAVFDDSHTS